MFTVVFPKLNAQGEQTGELEGAPVNLIDAHSRLTLEQVAQSCKWYASWPDENDSPWFKENLSLSCDYLFAHMEKDLLAKIQERYEPYRTTLSAGGPVVFKLLMAQIQSTTPLVVEHLRKQLKNLTLQDYPGEDVGQLASHAKAVIKRLRGLEQRDANNRVIGDRHVPDSLAKELVGVFQTSSSPTFNSLFRQKEIAIFEVVSKTGKH